LAIRPIRTSTPGFVANPAWFWISPDLALARLETAIRLVDDVKAPFATHKTIVAMTSQE